MKSFAFLIKRANGIKNEDRHFSCKVLVLLFFFHRKEPRTKIGAVFDHTNIFFAQFPFEQSADFH